MVEKYTSGLYTFHRDGCFWRDNACPGKEQVGGGKACWQAKALTHDVSIATIYSFPKLSTVEALDMMRKSGREWLQSGVRLPKIIHPLVS